MDADPKQPFWNTTLATLTAVGTMLGAIGGLIATVYAVAGTDSGDAVPSPTPAPPAASTAAPSPTPTAIVQATPRSSPTPVSVEMAPEADSWWGPPGTSPGEEDDSPGESEYLALDWGCSEDSRGNGSKEDCGSGLIAIRFDLTGLPDGVEIEEVVLRLSAVEGSETEVHVRRAASEWTEDGETEPDCDSGNETAAEVTEDEWRWDVTIVVQEQQADVKEDFGFCLILKENATVIFSSREGDDSGAPALTITYR